MNADENVASVTAHQVELVQVKTTDSYLPGTVIVESPFGSVVYPPEEARKAADEYGNGAYAWAHSTAHALSTLRAAELMNKRPKPRPIQSQHPIVGCASPAPRNAKCPCGSGRKFKKCHGTTTLAEMRT